MKPYALLSFLLSFCFFISCNSSDGSENTNKQNNNPETSEDLSVILAYYQMEVINNTGSTVTVFQDGFYYYSQEDEYYFWAPNHELCTITSNMTGTAEFFWAPKQRLYYRDSYYLTELPLPIPTEDEMKARLQPGINSFFLRILIDDAEYYLAGWPQQLNLPPLLNAYNGIGSADFDFILDTSKIVQYGIGFGDNKEIRVKYLDGLDPLYGSDHLYYVPFIISYTQNGQTVECDFDYTKTVYGKVMLTISAPDKIEFETLSLSLYPDDL